MSVENNYEDLKAFSISSGASILGVADLRKLKEDFSHLPQMIVKKLDYGISIGFRLSDSIIEGIEDRPTQLYFHHYKQVNYFLDRLALQITNFIQKLGYQALPIPASQVIDREKQMGHLSHKKVAVQAGLGWLGRNNLVVNPEFGARIRFVTILTDLPLKVDKPLSMDCGRCKKCLSICPVDAIKEKAEDFDHLACYRQLEVFRRTCNIGHHICGICVKACKPNRASAIQTADHT